MRSEGLSIEDLFVPFCVWVVEFDMLPSVEGRPLRLDADVVFYGEAKSALLAIRVSEVVRLSRLVVES